jgi:DtxR family Mn-dependent transcriptional regulator
VERVEEYLEAILDIQEREKRLVRTSDIAKKLNVKPSSVTEMLLKLKDMGYVDYIPYRGVTLTDKGREIAERIKKYYRVFERFFRDFLGIDEEYAKKLSCEMEHHVNDEIIEKICNIIAGSCGVCEACEFKALSLYDAEDGEYVILASPSSVVEIGIRPERRITVSKSKVIIDNVEFELSKDVAKKIIVRRV